MKRFYSTNSTVVATADWWAIEGGGKGRGCITSLSNRTSPSLDNKKSFFKT